MLRKEGKRGGRGVYVLSNTKKKRREGEGGGRDRK